MASGSGYETKSLYERGKEMKDDDPYDYDPYDDDDDDVEYNSHNLSEDQSAVCDAWDIKIHVMTKIIFGQDIYKMDKDLWSNGYLSCRKTDEKGYDERSCHGSYGNSTNLQNLTLLVESPVYAFKCNMPLPRETTTQTIHNPAGFWPGFAGYDRVWSVLAGLAGYGRVWPGMPGLGWLFESENEDVKMKISYGGLWEMSMLVVSVIIVRRLGVMSYVGRGEFSKAGLHGFTYRVAMEL
nr:hypothetical protein [Tanacetum cinerariifolium]